MLSILAAVVALTLAVTFAWFGWWEAIFGYLGGLDIRINTAGYLCIGIPLFLAWLVVWSSTIGSTTSSSAGASFATFKKSETAR